MKTANTKASIAGIALDSYILNASGVNDSTLEELEIIAKSDSSAIVMKSCTLAPRKGNVEPRYSRLQHGAIQCMGLPNLGYKKYIEFASMLKKYSKPIIASIAGASSRDYSVMEKAFQNSDVNMIEINISCPNMEGNIIGYDFVDIESILQETCEYQFKVQAKPVGLKLPPYYNVAQQKIVAELIKGYDISFITCINSLGNSLVINPETETPVIKPKKGIGALCGEYIKPIALANVRNFYELLDNNKEKDENEISIIGCGGIFSGKDAFEFLLAGADAVQVGTIFEKEGAPCFERINNELEKILQEKGYASIKDVKGKLKYL